MPVSMRMSDWLPTIRRGMDRLMMARVFNLSDSFDGVVQPQLHYGSIVHRCWWIVAPCSWLTMSVRPVPITKDRTKASLDKVDSLSPIGLIHLPRQILIEMTRPALQQRARAPPNDIVACRVIDVGMPLPNMGAHPGTERGRRCTQQRTSSPSLNSKVG